jgi:translation initiation factor 1A
MYKSRIQNVKQRSKRDEKNRELELPDSCQEFAIVQEMLGNGRVRIMCEDKLSRVGRICGSMRRYKSKVLIEIGDLVIISKRDYEKDKVDIIHKYALDEANKLTYEGYLPEYLYKVFTKDDKFNIGTNNAEEAPNDYIFFTKGPNDEFNVEDI